MRKWSCGSPKSWLVRGECLTPSVSKDRQGMKENRFTSDFAAPFSMWEEQTRGGIGRRPRSVEIKKGRKLIKAKVFSISQTYLPPAPFPLKGKKPSTTRPKLKSKVTPSTACTSKHQDADASRCDCGPKVMAEDGSYYKQFLLHSSYTCYWFQPGRK